jgi:hypothetical protein
MDKTPEVIVETVTAVSNDSVPSPIDLPEPITSSPTYAVKIPKGKTFPRQVKKRKPSGQQPSPQFLAARPHNPQEISFRRKHGDEGWLFILRMYAEFNSQKQIIAAVKERYNWDLTQPSLSGIVNGSQAQLWVKSFRDDFLSKLQEIPISNKKIRLMDYQTNIDVLNEIISDLRAKREGDSGLTADEKMELARFISLSTALKSEVREEMEKRPQLFQNVNVNMNGMSDEQLQRRKQELLSRIRRADERGAFGAESDTIDSGAEAEAEPS